MRKLSIVAGLVVGLSLTGLPSATAQGAGGPIILMGIDAEDCGPGGHGPISVYEDVVSSILSNVSNGGSGILVFGGDGVADCVTLFWNTIAADLGIAVTYVEGADNISSQSFAGFAMLAVASDENQTFGGLTVDEHEALSARQADVAAFVNAGGGLIGFSSTFDPSTTSGPYAYLGGIGSFSVSFSTYDDIKPTSAGAAIGITDDLDVCCWHNIFDSFPAFLQVLAHVEGTTDVAALGGEQVVVGGECPGFEIKGNFILGTSGDDELKGTYGVDTICGLAGNDFIFAGHGNDQVAGNAGADHLLGSRGGDHIKGGPGNDLLVGGRGRDTLNGGPGFDICKGGSAKDTFKNCEVIKDK
jgi:Ca2+-binding RTX toxin-like protein